MIFCVILQKHLFLSKNCYGYFLGNFLEILGHFTIQVWSHWLGMSLNELASEQSISQTKLADTFGWQFYKHFTIVIYNSRAVM